MGTRIHNRNVTFGLPDGTQPLVQNGIRNAFAGGVSMLRERVTLELYVEAVSSAGNLVNFLAMNACDVVFGLVAYDTAVLQTTTTTPITTPADPPGSLGWLCWEPMYPTVNYFKESDVETATWTWRTDPITIDVQGRRRTTVGNNPSWWPTWEIVDNSGSNFLNNTVAGTTYALGYRLYWDVLFETFP